jgi:iron(III) transport system permease protein
LPPPVKVLAYVIALAVAALVAFPLAGLVRLAALGDTELWPHLAAHVLPVALTETLLLLLGVAAIIAVAGVGTAWLVTTFQFPGRDTLLWVLPLPLAIPTYIAAYIYVDILDSAGPLQTALRGLFGWRVGTDYWFPPIRSLGGAIFVIGFVLYPYVYIAARAMFQTQCTAFIEAARMVGAKPWRLLCDIAVPLARPALAVGVALALLETLNDIGASEYLGVQTLTLSVFTTWLNRGSLGGAAQIALAMLAMVAMLVALERYGRRRQSYRSETQDPAAGTRIVLRGGTAWCATFACFTPVALGFFIPAGFLLREVILRGLLTALDPALLRHTATTIVLAACATSSILVLGVAAAVSLRLVRRPMITICVAVAALGYAVPGTVLALGLLSPLVGIDEAINWVSTHLIGLTVGLVLQRGVDRCLRCTIHLDSNRLRASRTGTCGNRARRSRAALRRQPTDSGAQRAPAVNAAGSVGRGAACVRRLPEGIADNAVAAAAQRRNTVDLYLPVRDARQFRGRCACSPADRRRRHPAGYLDRSADGNSTCRNAANDLCLAGRGPGKITSKRRYRARDT